MAAENKQIFKPNNASKLSYTELAASYTIITLNRLWRIAFSSLQDVKQLPKEPASSTTQDETVFFDFDPLWLTSFMKAVYVRVLSQDLLGVTKQSLDILRFQSNVFQGLQDCEVVKVLKSIVFGVMPREEKSTKEKPAVSITGLVWRTGRCLWRTVIGYAGFGTSTLPWLQSPVTSVNNSDQAESGTTLCNHSQSLSVCTLLMCEVNNLGQTISHASGYAMYEVNNLGQTVSDASEYAITSTTDMFSEAILLFVPMEILVSTAQLLKSSVGLAGIPPMAALWQLLHYIKAWGLDIAQDLSSLPDIRYVNIPDEDFHFVVNVPNLKRPILFIGVR